MSSGTNIEGAQNLGKVGKGKKRCKICQGIVHASARKCKHCGSVLVAPKPKPPPGAAGGRWDSATGQSGQEGQAGPRRTSRRREAAMVEALANVRSKEVQLLRFRDRLKDAGGTPVASEGGKGLRTLTRSRLQARLAFEEGLLATWPQLNVSP